MPPSAGLLMFASLDALASRRILATRPRPSVQRRTFWMSSASNIAWSRIVKAKPYGVRFRRLSITLSDALGIWMICTASLPRMAELERWPFRESPGLARHNLLLSMLGVTGSNMTWSGGYLAQLRTPHVAACQNSRSALALRRRHGHLATINSPPSSICCDFPEDTQDGSWYSMAQMTRKISGN